MPETGDDRAARVADFEAAVLPFAAGLLRAARHITGDPTTADDLVQETLMQAWRAFHQFELGTNSRAWLFRIMLNLWSKARSRRRRDHLRTVPLEGVVVAREPAIQEQMQVRQALATLPEEQRMVLLLGVVEGFTCREIGEMLVLPIGTVMSRLARGRTRMRALLAQPAEREVEVTE